MARAGRDPSPPPEPGHFAGTCRHRPPRIHRRLQRQRTTMADATDSVRTLSPQADPLRRKLISGGVALFLLPVIPRLAHAATILAVRTWPADEYTRVTLEMDSELKAEHFVLDDPYRLVVDIDGLSMSR